MQALSNSIKNLNRKHIGIIGAGLLSYYFIKKHYNGGIC